MPRLYHKAVSAEKQVLLLDQTFDPVFCIDRIAIHAGFRFARIGDSHFVSAFGYMPSDRVALEIAAAAR